MNSPENILGDMTEAQRRYHLRHLRFPPALERTFRDGYDREILPGLRGGLLLLLALFAAQGLAVLVSSHVLIPQVWLSAATLLGLLLATWHPRFLAVWQPLVVAIFCVLACLLLLPVAHQVPAGVSRAIAGPFHANTLMLDELLIIIVGCALTRLRFVWFVIGCLAIAALTVAVAVRTPDVSLTLFLGGTGIFIVPSLAALMLVTYLQERRARGEFLALALLDWERADERRLREQTEGMLHILSQAIGGIVHDLGNPLTAVRTGAETLRFLGQDGTPDPALESEVLGIISEGALMLDYLRLSLLEQTRVLEGKPIPIQCESVSIRRIIEASTHYQKPRLTSTHHVSAVGEDLEIQADAMKMITVFMNLLGNALKYSDGEIKLVWRESRAPQGTALLLCAVLDRGQSSVGLSQTQAKQLFVPFGRLDTHIGLEGTGLGLLSAQKIVEAHGGEIFIEGYTDGRSDSAPFSTAQGRHPTMLEPGFRTAFVVTCPFEAHAPIPGAPLV